MDLGMRRSCLFLFEGRETLPKVGEESSTCNGAFWKKIVGSRLFSVTVRDRGMG
jgi:hypothetical protein